MLVYIGGKDTASFVSALCREVGQLPPEELKKPELGSRK
jgi:hypothetical protein|tara:strand:+ start:3182 stop:3298 length:117 start_codon:yes stop_codon:yes gene_type:complete